MHVVKHILIREYHLFEVKSKCHVRLAAGAAKQLEQLSRWRGKKRLQIWV
jgi:hypothetical protein